MEHKATIETLINTVAIALTSWGILNITQQGGFSGYLSISFGLILEFFKYYGRSKELW